MLTRVEIDGFKTFQKFGLDLRPLSAIVGPNASGKSNLFDALRFLSLLAQQDIRTAMQDLRGLPEELFRRTAQETSTRVHFAIEVLLNREGVDAFGTPYVIYAQRLRYELVLQLSKGPEGLPRSVSVKKERCFALSKREDGAANWLPRNINYNARISLHARSQAICEAAHAKCNWPPEHCIIVAPRHELEAWAIADGAAVCDSLGYNGSPASLGLPATPTAAERLPDPKSALAAAVKQVRGSRRPISISQLLPTIAQRQDLAELRRLAQFRALENAIARALRSLGAIA